MNALLLEDDINAEKALKLQKKISELTAKMEEEALIGMLKAHSVLTSEQRAQLPPGCSLGFGVTNCSQGPCMSGKQGFGRCRNMGMGKGSNYKQGRCW